VSLSLCHCATVSLKGEGHPPGGRVGVGDKYIGPNSVTVSLCHYVTVSLCHYCHCVTVSLCHCVTVSQCHSREKVIHQGGELE